MKDYRNPGDFNRGKEKRQELPQVCVRMTNDKFRGSGRLCNHGLVEWGHLDLKHAKKVSKLTEFEFKLRTRGLKKR